MARELINVEAVDRSFGAVDVLRDINIKVNDARVGESKSNIFTF